MSLRIILRTCSGQSVHFNNRFIDVTKSELILQCLKSLVVSLAKAPPVPLALTVVDDHSDDACCQQIRAILSHCPFPTEFIPLSGSGNNASMKFCYEYGRNCQEELIYFVEDDYLHQTSCLTEMIQSFHYFLHKMRRNNPAAEVAIMPVDNLFHYWDQTMFSSPLVLGLTRHWRVNYYSNWTMLISKAALLEHWKAFWKFSDYQLGLPETHEDATLVPIFRQAVALFTPIPTLALHVASADYISPFSNWEETWQKVDRAWFDLISPDPRTNARKNSPQVPIVSSDSLSNT